MSSITFRVNLETPLRRSHAEPNMTRAEADHYKETRVTWFPNNVLNNRSLKHGDEFTVDGKEAQYLKNNYVTGDYAFLEIVSEGLVFSEEGEIV